jgi:hypothetical protein
MYRGKTMISETHEQLATAVAYVHRKVAWDKMTSKKRSTVDVLTDRLRVCSHEPEVIGCMEKLCSSLHLPCTDIPTDLIEALYLKNSEVMEIFRNHPGYIAALAHKKAKEGNYEYNTY